MENFKGTKGRWFVNLISDIPIGVNAEIATVEDGCYSKNVCEIILPDDDAAWELCKEEETANLKLMAASKELLEALQGLVSGITNQHNDLHIADQKRVLKAQKAILKALD